MSRKKDEEQVQIVDDQTEDNSPENIGGPIEDPTGTPDVPEADSPEAKAEEDKVLTAEEKKSEPAMEKYKPQTLEEEDGFEMFSQLVACVHFLASMMPADVFQQAKDSFPVITKIR